MVQSNNDIENYIARISIIEATDDAGFHQAIVDGFKLLDLTEYQLAYEFETSKRAVRCWRNNKNFPHPAMRKFVIEYLINRARICDAVRELRDKGEI